MEYYSLKNVLPEKQRRHKFDFIQQKYICNIIKKLFKLPSLSQETSSVMSLSDFLPPQTAAFFFPCTWQYQEPLWRCHHPEQHKHHLISLTFSEPCWIRADNRVLSGRYWFKLKYKRAERRSKYLERQKMDRNKQSGFWWIPLFSIYNHVVHL